MRKFRNYFIILTTLISTSFVNLPVQAETFQILVTNDSTYKYNRTYFKHWIDADSDGCDTRAEVLIEEAITKPTVGAKCKLTGGRWISSYDGKTITNASQLDVDHLVPLAEAWRSGAYRWDSISRMNFANDLENSKSLNAVSSSSNRSKGDKDPSKWLPIKNKCEYLADWISIKAKYYLSMDKTEFQTISNYKSSCNLDFITNLSDLPEPPTPTITVENWREFNQDWPLVKMSIEQNSVSKLFRSGFSIVSDKDLTKPGEIIINCFKGSSALQGDRTKNENIAGGFFLSPNGRNTELFVDSYKGEIISCVLTPYYDFKISFKYMQMGAISNSLPSRSSTEFVIKASKAEPSPTPSPTPTPVSIVTPGAFCSPAGAIGQSTAGISYTCKTSPTDARNRWRQ